MVTAHMSHVYVTHVASVAHVSQLAHVYVTHVAHVVYVGNVTNVTHVYVVHAPHESPTYAPHRLAPYVSHAHTPHAPEINRTGFKYKGLYCLHIIYYTFNIISCLFIYRLIF